MNRFLSVLGFPGLGKVVGATWPGGLLVGLGVLLCPGLAHGQTTLADYDYENLSFRGFSLEVGHLWPSRAESTYSVGGRVDLGYLGPGLRLSPWVSYWSSDMKNGEVAKLARRLDELVEAQLDPGEEFAGVDLGTINWSDFVVGLDGHFVWSVPWDFLTFAGGGVSVHVMDGDGAAIRGTFVEDLLDSLKPGFNLHAGLEYLLADGFRLYGTSRYELTEDLRYFEIRLGGQVMLTGPAQGEERSR